MKKTTKIMTVVLSLVLVAALSIGGTVAWLTAKTDTVTNTFTFGNIDITLTETENLDLKIVPGKPITKDPKATVQSGSEACYLFVELNKVNWLPALTYEIADGWTRGTDEDGIPTNVIYREVPAADKDQTFDVLKDNKVNVNGELTKAQVEAAMEQAPQLNLTAYAVQQQGIASAADAWAKIASVG